MVVRYDKTEVDMQMIPLSNSDLYVLIDDEDYEHVAGMKWR